MAITITRSHQPHSVETWEIETSAPVVASPESPDYIKSRAKKGWVEVTGRIVKGHSTSRLFTSTRTEHYVDKVLMAQIPSKYLEDGAHYVTVAM